LQVAELVEYLNLQRAALEADQLLAETSSSNAICSEDAVSGEGERSLLADCRR